MQPEVCLPREWLLKARHDWLAAQTLFAADRRLLDAIGFHCQQAVEKMLKAFLAARGIEFEKTHDIGWLLDLCTQEQPSLEVLRNDVQPLSAFAVAFRYPGPSEPTLAQVERALSVVRNAWEAITAHLPAEVIPDL